LAAALGLPAVVLNVCGIAAAPTAGAVFSHITLAIALWLFASENLTVPPE